MRRFSTLVLSTLVFAIGCVTMPTQEEIANFDYGSPLTVDYKAAIVKYFEPILFDPYSAVIQFQEPHKWWFKDARMSGGRIWAGYVVPTRINAKNRMGGYTGMQEYDILFKNNEIIKVLGPDDIALMTIRPTG